MVEQQKGWNDPSVDFEAKTELVNQAKLRMKIDADPELVKLMEEMERENK